MTPSTTLSICFNKKNSKLILQMILQIDFSQMDTETQEKFLADLFEKALQKNLQAYWITTTETKNVSFKCSLSFNLSQLKNH
ncbi:hypothetical protein KVC13_04915 [Helicobacter pylori]|nr:hypothetical protein KVC13_04915 [Helicobacter pylori]